MAEQQAAASQHCFESTWPPCVHFSRLSSNVFAQPSLPHFFLGRRKLQASLAAIEEGERRAALEQAVEAARAEEALLAADRALLRMYSETDCVELDDGSSWEAS